MKFIVHAVTQDVVSIEVEANNPIAAMEKAGRMDRSEWDVWDSDIHITDATATF